MARRNLLVVVLEDATWPKLREAIAERGDGPPHVRVVAPTRAGLLEWLATDEDRARSEAEVRALESEWLLSDQAEIEGEAGDVDPVLAVLYDDRFAHSELGPPTLRWHVDEERCGEPRGR